jgi:flagellin-like protein
MEETNMKMFRKDEEAVSPVIGVILMVAITVILAAVIAAFVFGLGGNQNAAPTASITAANNPDKPAGAGMEMKIQHKGGDTLKAGEWKVSVVPVGTAPQFILSNSTANIGTLAVGAQIIVTADTTGGIGSCPDGVNATLVACGTTLNASKYDVKLVHVPSNAMLLDQVIDVH